MTGSTLTLSPKPNSGARQADVRVLDGGCQGLPVGGPQGAALQGDRGRSGGGEEGHVRYTRVWYIWETRRGEDRPQGTAWLHWGLRRVCGEFRRGRRPRPSGALLYFKVHGCDVRLKQLTNKQRCALRDIIKELSAFAHSTSRDPREGGPLSTQLDFQARPRVQRDPIFLA